MGEQLMKCFNDQGHAYADAGDASRWVPIAGDDKDELLEFYNTKYLTATDEKIKKRMEKNKIKTYTLKGDYFLYDGRRQPKATSRRRLVTMEKLLDEINQA